MKTKLLIVEKKTTIQKTAKSAFKNQAFSIESVGSGEDALLQIGEMQPDVVVVDIETLGAGGYDLCGQIKDAAEGIVFLFVVSKRDFDADLFKASGADGYLFKPFKSDDFAAKVEQALDSIEKRTPKKEAETMNVLMSDIIGEAGLSPDQSASTEEIEEIDEVEEGVSALDPIAEMDDVISELIEDSVLEPSVSNTLVEPPSPEPVLESVEEQTSEVSNPLAQIEEDKETKEINLEKVLGSAASLFEDDKPETREREILSDQTAGEEEKPKEETSRAMESVSPTAFSSEPGTPSPQSTPPGDRDNMAEVASTTAPAEELDTAFESIQELEGETEDEAKLPSPFPTTVSHTESETVSMDARSSFAEDIIQLEIKPEPEDLLERLAPSAFTSKSTKNKPDLINETLSYLSDLSPGKKELQKEKQDVTDNKKNLSIKVPPLKEEPARILNAGSRRKTVQRKETPMSAEHKTDMFVQIVGEHIKRILERSLQESIDREISGLSETIERSVREIVKEVTPEIARSIIQEEVEKIRNLEEV